MNFLKIVLLVIFFIVAFAIIVISFITVKDEQGASNAIMGGAKDSYYEKNKGKSKEEILDNVIKGLFVVFVLVIIALYYVY